MEPLTQALLGAAVGQVVAPSLGRKALAWGALVGMSPDLDVLLGSLQSGFGELIHHRGTTHSLWFGFAVGPPLAWLLWRWRDREGETRLREWVALCVCALVTHPLLDGFTPYGTQFLAPFDRTRFAFHGVGIIDPFYTVVLAWAVVAACRARPLGEADRRRTRAALVLSTLYLFVGIGLNEYARRDVHAIVGADADVRIYPTVLQPFLRRVVVRDGEEGIVGWHTTLAPGCPWWEHFAWPAKTEEARELESTWEGRTMRWFAMDDVLLRTLRMPDGGAVVEMDDLRYGLPGMPPDRSMWGVRAVYDERGQRSGAVLRFRRGQGEVMLAGFFDWALGRFEGTGLRGAHPASCGS